MNHCFEDSQWIGKLPERIHIDTKRVLDSMQEQAEQIDVQQGTAILRKTFLISGDVSKASLKIAGLGIYRAKINGVDMDDGVLKPITTDFRKVVLYDQVEVSHLLKQGKNCITIEVGAGWYSAQKKYWDWRMGWLGNPKADVRLDISMCSGENISIVSDSTWKCCDGAVTFCCIYDGETCDGRILQQQWNNPEYDDSHWGFANIVPPPEGKLILRTAPNIKVCKRNSPVNVYKISENEFTYEYAYNCTGWSKITVQGKTGDRIEITHAEQIFPDKTINTESNRAALNTDTYILGSDGIETYEPGFTYHGFRYVRITISSSATQILNVEQCHIHSDVAVRGEFICSNYSIQKIHNACVLTQKNALQGVPLDCCQRDERLGWLGDAWVTSKTCLYNFNMKEFYRNWLRDIALTAEENRDISFLAPRPQLVEPGSPDFSSGFLVILWNCYRHYGEKELILEHFNTAKNYVDYLLENAQDFMLDKGRYGDWKSLVKGFHRGDPYYGNTMHMFMDMCIVIEFAKIIGQNDIAQEYSALVEEMRAVLRTTLYDSMAKKFGAGDQFSNSFALLLNIIPENDELFVLNNLMDDIRNNNLHLTTGIFGTKFVMEALRKYNQKDLICELLLQDKYPSWLDMLKNSTTLTETWDGMDMSRGHCMFGSVDSQMYESICGIEINHMAEHVITIRPHMFSQIGNLEGTVYTEYGAVSVKYQKCENADTILNITLPINISSCVYLADKDKIVLKQDLTSSENQRELYFIMHNGLWKRKEE